MHGKQGVSIFFGDIILTHAQLSEIYHQKPAESAEKTPNKKKKKEGKPSDKRAELEPTPSRASKRLIGFSP